MQINTQQTEDIISLADMASKLGLSPNTLIKKCRDGRIPSYKYLGKWVFILSEVLEDIRNKGGCEVEKEKPEDLKSTGTEEGD